MRLASVAITATLLAASTAARAAAGPIAVTPVTPLAAKTICVIENPEIRPEFLEAYRAALAAKGFDVAVLRKPDRFYACPVTSTYVAFWAGDVYTGFINSLAFCRLSVYADGKPLGSAEFHRSSGYVMPKAGNTLTELVDQLFPGR